MSGVVTLQAEYPRRTQPDHARIRIRATPVSSHYSSRLSLSSLSCTDPPFGTETVSNSTIATHITPRVPPLNLIILHCMRSQTRGPYAAHLLAHSPALPPGVQIRVMKGGFQGWWRQFKGRRELFENLEGAGSEWEEAVLAPEGSRREADDSRRLREQG